MLLYITILICPTLIALAFPKQKYSVFQGKCVFFILLVFFVFVTGFRSIYLGSGDTQGYINYYKSAVQTPSLVQYMSTKDKDSLFYITIWLMARIVSLPQSIVFFSSLFVTISYFLFIRRNTRDFCLGVTAYVCLGLWLFNMQGMRQAIAMSICLFAYEEAKKRNFLKFVIIVLVASLYHRTALVFFVAYFPFYLHFRLGDMVIVLCAGLALLLLSPVILQIGNLLFDKEYTDTVFESGGIIATLIYVLMAVFVFWFDKRRLQFDRNESSLFYIYIIAIFIYLLRYLSVNIAERIAYYFLFPFYVLVPNSFDGIRREGRNGYSVSLLKLGVSSIMILYGIYRGLGGFSDFHFFWGD